jgi:hypothetical protein
MNRFEQVKEQLIKDMPNYERTDGYEGIKVNKKDMEELSERLSYKPSNNSSYVPPSYQKPEEIKHLCKSYEKGN